jgi:hypothetical protein
MMTMVEMERASASEAMVSFKPLDSFSGGAGIGNGEIG